jgi:hypothetical protein
MNRERRRDPRRNTVAKRLPKSNADMESSGIHSGERNEELYRLAEELIAYLVERLPQLTSRPDAELIGRQLAVAALARMVALLQGMLDVIRAGHGVVAGGLLRSLYETQLFGFLVLLGGPPAMVDVMDAYAKGMKTYHAAQKTKLSQGFEEWLSMGLRKRGLELKSLIGRLNYEQVAKKVKSLLHRKRDQERTARSENLYDSVYRTESMVSAHATLSSIGAYVDWKSSPWKLRAHPRGSGDLPNGDRTVLAIGMTTHLASFVLEEFGYSRSFVDSLWERIGNPPNRIDRRQEFT